MWPGFNPQVAHDMVYGHKVRKMEFLWLLGLLPQPVCRNTVNTERDFDKFL